MFARAARLFRKVRLSCSRILNPVLEIRRLFSTTSGAWFSAALLYFGMIRSRFLSHLPFPEPVDEGEFLVLKRVRVVAIKR